MDGKCPLWQLGLFLLLVGTTLADEDLLQNALDSVHRRQRDFYYQPRYEDVYSDSSFGRYGPDSSEEIPYGMGALADDDPKRNPELENLLLQYLEDNPKYDYANLNKRLSAYFKDRVTGNERKRENLGEILLNKYDDDDQITEDEDDIEQLCNKYRLSFPELTGEISRLCGSEEVSKRSFSDYYTTLGWDSIGMKKRNRALEPHSRRELLNYILNQENPNYDNIEKYDPRYYPSYKRGYSKKFPVTKRSSNYYAVPTYHHASETTRQQKRSPQNKASNKTDPKVVKDLSNIFTPAKDKPKTETQKSTKNKTKTVSKSIKHDATTTTNKPKTVKKSGEEVKVKEIVPDASKEEPLQIQKKSINWSDYFGMDRRKKSGDDLDNEWLLERYHKAIVATKKRTEHNHEEIKKDDSESDKQDIDETLKNMEESIVDDTLKYTGAHEDVEDPKEVQEIKNNIISRLVAAYNLEKMRRALDEYRMSIAKEKSRLMKEPDQSIAYPVEEKRVSVPRKSAIDEDQEKSDADNSIKCSHAGDDCDEQNYKPLGDILKQTNWEIVTEECPKVQRACNEAASVLGTKGKILEEACNIHQMCLLCGDNSWFAPTRQCNILFLAKADELCDGDVECQKMARQSVRYLVDVNRLLRNEPYSSCELACPGKKR